MFKAAVTGTNGKTSVVYMASQLMTFCGFKTASLGTLGVISGDYSDSDPILVGPNAIPDLIEELTQVEDIDSFLFEAFSSAIDAKLYDKIDIDVAALTNIGTDHLDYHGSQENYVNAKLRLFKEIISKGKSAVFYHDDEIAEKIIAICEKRSLKYVSYGISSNATVNLIKLNRVGYKTQVTIAVRSELYKTTLPFVGDIFVQNWLCALCVCLIQEQAIEQLMTVSKRLALPPGRMEKIANRNIYIDYAHNADALEAVLKMVNHNYSGRVHLVFGCGGDNDHGKREAMGRIANQYAEKIYITDDNPRTESAEKIRASVLQYCPRGIGISSRQDAIQIAINELKQNDVLLIAGKGHETHQDINGKQYEYSDQDAVLNCCKQ